MDKEHIEKIFPDYFQSFKMPEDAKEHAIEVYRACFTGIIEKESFLNTYEENGFKVSEDGDITDCMEYSMSTYQNPKEIRRFCVLDGKYSPPWLAAKGKTNPQCGLCQLSSEREDYINKKSSHVDYWLYTDAEPWQDFESVGDIKDEIKKYNESHSRI